MEKIDPCKYVDVFYGNGETDRFFKDGLASKWFYIKALCGNTTPHAVLPFGKMSVGAYSGGYPTGYGTYCPNFCGGVPKMAETQRARGFSHLHHTGTGAIRYYYNYAVVTPFYGEDPLAILEELPLTCERGEPGYYGARLGEVQCELTLEGGVALHRYTFGKKGGRLAIDFSNDGLARSFGEGYYAAVKEPELRVVGEDAVFFSGIFSGIRLYFYAKVEAPSPRVSLFSGSGAWAGSADKPAAPYGAIFDFAEDTVLLRVGFSTVSEERARKEVEGARLCFREAADRAREMWNQHLSRFQIQTQSEELKTKFYSNLYHSIIKPCDMTGEEILGVKGETVSDLATFWDQYKTVLPLVYLCYPEMRDKIARGIVNISRSLGKIPCSFGLTEIFPCEEQAKMLGVLTLCDAYRMGATGVGVAEIEECIQRELAREDYRSFLEEGIFERYTHIIDATDACLAVAELTEREDLKKRLRALAENWKKAYGPDGLMSEKSPYYEGDRYTYSFRLQKNMPDRVALAGGPERFCEMLDRFFGFEGESVQQLTYIGAGEEIAKTRHHRFEGFNNECDMETPYAYIYAGRHDRLCAIMKECVSRSFGLGTGGLPGNNDSGGLSSAFIFNALGLFPASGSGNFLIGCPGIDGAQIALATGKELTIRVNRQEECQGIVARVTWNGSPVSDHILPMQAVMAGGTLEFFMK